MPLQIRATPSPGGARFSSKEPSVFPLYLIFFSSPSFTFVWFSFLLPVFLLNLPRVVQSHRRRRAASRRRRIGRGGGVARENPLRNVFGPCAARYYLQSRAYIKYTCGGEDTRVRKRKKGERGRERRWGAWGKESQKGSLRKRTWLRTKARIDFQIRFNCASRTRTRPHFFLAMNMYTVAESAVSWRTDTPDRK